MFIGTAKRSRSQPQQGPHQGRVSLDAPSVVGPTVTIWGRLDAIGEVEVRGTVSGDITATKVILSPGGYVEGNIQAEEAHIYGHLNGKTVARTVVIGAGATIEGQIFHHIIDMGKGHYDKARFPWRPANYFE